MKYLKRRRTKRHYRCKSRTKSRSNKKRTCRRRRSMKGVMKGG